MSFWDDDRAASVQIGAVILFGFLIVSMAVYQATVVPQENARIEYEHSLRAQDDMQTVRNSIVSASGGGTASSVGVTMAPQYPTRALFVNPGPPTGTVRTVGTTDPGVNLTIGNATVPDSEADDFWDGSAKAYNSGGLVYQPNYNVYTGAPLTIYENTVLYNHLDNGPNVTKAGQNLVDGRTISLVTLNGSLDRTESGTFTVDPEKLSASRESVALQNTGGNVTVSFASRLDAAWWTERLSGELVANGGNVVDVRSSPLSGPFYNVTLELVGGETYTLQMAKVGIGSGTTDPGARYATDVAGGGSSVPERGTQQVVVEVRDKYNNPVTGVAVEADVSFGSLRDATVTTNQDGEAVFTYEAGEVDGVSQVEVSLNATFTSGVDPASSGFDGTTPENVSTTLYAQNIDGSGLGGGGGGGGGGAYSLGWQIDETQGVNCTDSDGDGTTDNCDINASKTTSVDLTAATTPTVEGITVDFGLNNSSVGTLSPSAAETGAAGEATTTFDVTKNGTVAVYASGGGSSDVVNLTVTNVGSGNSPPTANYTYTCSGLTCDFDASGSSDPDGTVDTYKWDWDNDGNYEDSTTSATISHPFPSPGDYSVTLQVIDNDSATDTVTKTVSVTVLTYVDQFNDGDGTAETLENDSIPPGGNALGDISSFGDMQADDGVFGAMDELNTVNQGGQNAEYRLNAGYNISGIPDASTHTLQMELARASADTEDLTVDIVYENGTVIQSTTISPTGTAQVFNVTLNGEATTYANNGGSVYVVVRDAGGTDTTQSLFDVDYVRVRSE